MSLYISCMTWMRHGTLVLILLANPLWASQIPQFELSDNIEPQNLSTLHWADSSQIATPAQAKAAIVSGELITEHFNLPPQPTRHWFAFTLTNPTDHAITPSVYIKQPFLQIVNLHYQNQLQDQPQSKWVSQLNGSDIRLKHRSVRTLSPTFSLSLAPHQEQTYYLEIYSEVQIFKVDIKIGETKDIYLFDLVHITLVKVFIGASLILSLINILMYFSFRDTVYLYYGAYSVSLVLTVTVNNLLDLFFEFPISDRSILYLGYNALVFFFSLFIAQVLDAKRTMPWFEVILKTIRVVAVVLAGLTLYDSKYLSYTVLVFLPFSIFVLSVTIYAAVVGNTSARLLSIGIVIFLSGAVITLLTNFGLMTSTLFSDHAAIFGALIQMMLFSVVLFRRVLALNEDKLAGNLALLDLAQQTDRAKSQFISTVSHELRTPLTAIKGALGLIQGGIFDKNPGKIPAIIDIAYKNADRLHHLINDILDIERLNVGKMNFQMESVDVSSLLEEAALSIETYGSQYGVTFVYSYTDELLYVNGDHHRLTQVMANLLSNAAKFSHRDGQVDVSLARHNGSIRVSVHDYGIGIPESARASIFDNFTQVDSSDRRNKDGSGLGLGIAKKIVEAHDGHINYTSKIGKGSTFYIDLAELTVDRSVTPLLRILLVDDQALFIEALSALITAEGEALGVQVVARVGSAKEALIQVQKLKPDLVLMDMHMPEISGNEAVELIKRDHPNTKILMLSSAESPDDVRAAKAAGADGYAYKSDSPKSLIADISRVMSGIHVFVSKYKDTL
jgi:signal transduction histidine kinase/CheY-like chemotaxis protein